MLLPSRQRPAAGAGAIGGTIVGAIAGAVAFTLGNAVFACSRSVALRWLIALPFAAFAAYAGYSIVLKLSELGVHSSQWRQIFALISCVKKSKLCSMLPTRPHATASAIGRYCISRFVPAFEYPS